MRPRAVILTFMTATLAAAPAPAQQPTTTPPRDAEEIRIDQKLGEQVPLDLAFTDDKGRQVTLGEYFDGDRPVMLTLVYYRCPALCSALINGLLYSLVDLEPTVGEQFDIVTVSIDPSETPELAAQKKHSYLGEYGRPAADAGWHFLVGDAEPVAALADAVGFRYRYQERTGLFTHAATVMIVTPDGRLSRYFNDVMFDPDELRLALGDARAGIIGRPAAHPLLRWCYVYDPSSGEWVVAARRIMSIGGALMVLIVFAGLGFMWRREARRAGSTRETQS